MVHIGQAAPIPVLNQPYPDALSYVREAVQISEGEGFKTDFDERLDIKSTIKESKGLFSSRYPPGFPIFLAPFALINGERGVQWGSKAVSVILPLLLALLALEIYGPLAAILTSIFVILSPFASESASLVFSDLFGAVITLLAIGALLMARRFPQGNYLTKYSFVLFGVFCGFGLLSRTSLVILLLAAGLVFIREKALKFIIIGALPFLILLGSYQWIEFGSPLRSGYSEFVVGVDEFAPKWATKSEIFGERAFIYSDRLNGGAVRWTCPCDEFGPMGKAPNIVFYPLVLAGMYWIFSPPVLGVVGLFYLIKRRSVIENRFAICVIFLNLVMSIFYFYQGARLVAPAGYLLLLFGSVGLAKLLTRLKFLFMGWLSKSERLRNARRPSTSMQS